MCLPSRSLSYCCLLYTCCSVLPFCLSPVCSSLLPFIPKTYSFLVLLSILSLIFSLSHSICMSSANFLLSLTCIFLLFSTPSTTSHTHTAHNIALFITPSGHLTGLVHEHAISGSSFLTLTAARAAYKRGGGGRTPAIFNSCTTVDVARGTKRQRAYNAANFLRASYRHCHSLPTKLSNAVAPHGICDMCTLTGRRACRRHDALLQRVMGAAGSRAA